MTDQADAWEGDAESPFVDLSALTLADVAELPRTVLGEALRAVMESAENPDDVFTTEHKETQARH